MILQMVSLSYIQNTEQTEWEGQEDRRTTRTTEDVVDFDSDLTAAMGDFQAFLYVRPDL